MRIALDVMGGDHAPTVTVAGAVAAARAYGVEVALVGRPDAIRAELGQHDTTGLVLPIVEAPEVIGMDEHAATAARRKPTSSIHLALRQVRDGAAAAMVSAGNSGAVMAAALFVLGRVPGIDRPAIGALLPLAKGWVFLIDAGANTDPKPAQLVQFGQMGAVYMERVRGVARPRVGLLANGEEPSKGNELVQAAHPLLAASGLNFVGNIEGKDVTAGLADVVVTDGFTGNVALKLTEGVASLLLGLIRAELTRDPLTKILAAGLKPAFGRVRQRLDYRETGGAPLLGVEGVTIIAHGRSDALAIQNAIRAAKETVEGGALDAIRSLRQGQPSGRGIE
ncbi:MAG TPA: phosphate acyltransferase PlsX [Thermomicrobiales bacterium]|nr:phosphate acyltransferase PlsX [Thermomicrobiales bacterium]